MTNIILLGPPGSGKGTQSKLLVEKKNFFQISTGDILRKAVNSGSDEGRTLKKIMDKGDLVPDDMVIKMMLDSVDLDKEKKIIFDGFPRNISQAKTLEKKLDEISMNIDFVIFLDVKFDILEDRIKKRISESGDKNKRTDDNEQIAIKRYQTYEKNSKQVIDFYKQLGLLRVVNGEGSISEINSEISALIEAI